MIFRARASSGYTLIEVVIALTITGLIMGFIFEGVFGAARLATQLSDRTAVLERQALAGDWFRTTIAAALPAQQRDPPALVGGAARVNLSSAFPLHARPGAPRTIAWLLVPTRGSMELVYEADSVSWSIARSERTGAYFSYLDEAGAWRRDWVDHTPPRLIALVDFWTYPIVVAPRALAAPEQPDASVIGGIIR